MGPLRPGLLLPVLQSRTEAGLSLSGKIFGLVLDWLVGYVYRPSRAFGWRIARRWQHVFHDQPAQTPEFRAPTAPPDARPAPPGRACPPRRRPGARLVPSPALR